MDCFAEPVIGPRVRADPLARNDDQSSANMNNPQLPARRRTHHEQWRKLTRP